MDKSPEPMHGAGPRRVRTPTHVSGTHIHQWGTTKTEAACTPHTLFGAPAYEYGTPDSLVPRICSWGPPQLRREGRWEVVAPLVVVGLYPAHPMGPCHGRRCGGAKAMAERAQDASTCDASASANFSSTTNMIVRPCRGRPAQ